MAESPAPAPDFDTRLESGLSALITLITAEIAHCPEEVDKLAPPPGTQVAALHQILQGIISASNGLLALQDARARARRASLRLVVDNA